MTYLEKVKQREAEIRNHIISWLDITEERYNNMLFESGFEYLQNVLKTDAYGMDHLPKSKAFWNMYIIDVWNPIDKAFLEAFNQEMMAEYPQWYCVVKDRDSFLLQAVKSKAQLRALYEHYHACEFSNPVIAKQNLTAQQHSVMKAIMEDFHNSHKPVYS
ncbi:MAG: hypothetical protein ACK5OS_02465 [Chryseotalea sp.]|jgi:hypothetical protein